MKNVPQDRERFQQHIGLGDKFYLAMHEVVQTMIYLVDLRLQGNISLEVHQAACQALINRLPILKSVITGGGGVFGRFRWEELDMDASDLLEHIDYYQDGQISEEESNTLYRQAYDKYSNTKWDIRKEPPFKVKIIRRGKELWNLFFLIHHSLSDAFGTVAILEVYAESYNLIAAGREVPKDRIPQVKRSMLKFFLSTPPWKLLVTLWGYLKYELMNRPRENTLFLTDWKQRTGTIRAIHLTFDKDLTQKLIDRVRKIGISMNEAMILACGRNVLRWIRSQGRDAGKISISVPVNLRSYLKLRPRESVGNCSVAMNINLRASLMENAEKLVQAIRFQSHGLKRLRFPLIGIILTGLFAWVPFRLLKKMLARSIETGQAARTTATIVYSNVGRIFIDEQGRSFPVPLGKEAVVDGFRVSNPIAYPVASSMHTVTYNRMKRFSLSYLDPVLKKEDMEAFLRGFRDELFAVMDEKLLTADSLPPFSKELQELDDPTGTILHNNTFQ